MLRKIVRIIIALLFFSGGIYLGYVITSIGILNVPNLEIRMALTIFPGLLAGLLGYSIAPLLIQWTLQSTRWVEYKLQKMPFSDLFGATIGLIIGLIIASLFGTALARVPFVGKYLSILIDFLFGYLGMSIGMKKKDDLSFMLPRFAKDKEPGKERIRSEAGHKTEEKRNQYKILDTSVIIDGRIADICKSGFLDGVLVIPAFVLEELRHIADSSDLLKRNRGRRGLDILNKIRKELDVMVQISEQDFADIQEVDSKLVRLAQVMGGQILTNDYNLNKVAELQGVKVLNINELANALKPVFLPGEEMVVQIIKDGKESRQGIGYLDDGTMIVVESGKRYINQTIVVVVTSVLQTAAGRMIFAKPKYNDKRTLYEEDAIG